jgi:hypothetical protein
MAPDSNSEIGAPPSAGPGRRWPGCGCWARSQEVGGELFALADVDRQDAVGQAGLFKEEGDLVAVGGGPVIEVDHGV